MRHFLSAADLTRDAALGLFALAADDKQRRKAGRLTTPLAGKTFALIFEKPSLRTRVTFEVGIIQLGGRAVHLVGRDIGLGTRESVPDVARNLSLWVDGIMARVYSHSTITALARHASVPVINGLSDREHPCQALADFFTLWERGVDFAKIRIAWIGDGNNVLNSWLEAATLFGFRLQIAVPDGFEPDAGLYLEAERRSTGGVRRTRDPHEAARGADVVYTDTWTSMGQEHDADWRRVVFAGYKVDPALMALAKADALFMHCLPAHRGEEVTDEVLDGPQSIIVEQAENRLHLQKALMLSLLGMRTGALPTRRPRTTHAVAVGAGA